MVADVAHQRGHEIAALRAADNPHASALTPQRLATFEVVLDFTTLHAAIENMEACIRGRKNVVVGTTGWYSELPRIRKMVEEAGTGFLYGANFSRSVNLFFETVRTAAIALGQGYSGQIFERHHAHKKDAPSGTALQLQGVVRDASGAELEIVSFREGDVVGMHELVLDSPADTIYLCHDAKSRLGFAEGAVRAAEWLAGKTGFFDFRDVWRGL